MLRATLLECDAAAWKWMAQDGSCEEEVRVWGAEHICLRHRGPQVETGTAGQKGSSSQVKGQWRGASTGMCAPDKRLKDEDKQNSGFRCHSPTAGPTGPGRSCVLIPRHLDQRCGHGLSPEPR